MSGNNISPTKRRPFPQFAGRKTGVTAKELQTSFDALPDDRPNPWSQTKPGLKPAPARTVRASCEAEFKRWLASQSQLLPASTRMPRYRYETSGDKSGEDESSSKVESESQSHDGLNAGSDSQDSHSHSHSNSDSSEKADSRRRRPGPKLAPMARPLPVAPLSLNRVRRTGASADRIAEPRRRLEKAALQTLADKQDFQSLLQVLNSILRIADGNQKRFSQSLHQLLSNLTANQRGALLWFEAQTQNGSGKTFGKWSEFAAAVNRSIRLIDDAATRPGVDARDSEDETNVACLVLRRAPESSILFDFAQANRDLRLV